MNDAIAQLALRWYASWLPTAGLVLALSVFVLAPLAFWGRARSWATSGMLLSSYVIGFTAWLLGAGMTFASFGWLGLIVGLLVFGVGVVPIGAVGAYFKLDDGGLAASIIGMALVAFALRLFATYMSGRSEVVGINKATVGRTSPTHDAIDAAELLGTPNDGSGFAEPSARIKGNPPES